MESSLSVAKATFIHRECCFYLIHAQQRTADKKVGGAMENVQQQTIFTFITSQEIAFSLAWSK